MVAVVCFSGIGVLGGKAAGKAGVVEFERSAIPGQCFAGAGSANVSWISGVGFNPDGTYRTELIGHWFASDGGWEIADQVSLDAYETFDTFDDLIAAALRKRLMAQCRYRLPCGSPA